jgi:cytochrome c biogenesis protein CcdA
MAASYTLILYWTLGLAIPLVGLVAMFMELHAQAQPDDSWWHDCRRPIQWVGRTSTAVSVGLFAIGALLTWGSA